MSVKSGNTEKRRKLMSHSTRRNLFVALLIILVVALCWYRSSLMQWGLQQLLEQTSLRTPKLSALQFDFKQAKLAGMEFSVETVTGDLSVKLETLRIEYDLKTRKVENISVKHAQLKFASHPNDKPRAKLESTTVPLELPLEKLTIEHLDVDIQTSWGVSHFSGRGELQHEAAGSFQAIFQDVGQVIRCKFDLGQSSVNLVVERIPNGQIIEFYVDHLDHPVQQIELHAGMTFLVEWLNTSSLIPETLKAKRAVSNFLGLSQNLSGMQLELNATTPDHYNSLQGKAMLTRDSKHLVDIDVLMTAQPHEFEVEGNLDMAANELYELLKPFSPGITDGLMISTGEIRGSMKQHWQFDKHSSGTAHIEVSNLGLTFGIMQVEAGNIELEFTDLAQRASRLSADAGTLKFGKAITATKLIVRGSNLGKVLTLNQALISIFGGKMELSPGTMAFDHYPIPVTVRLVAVDLSQLLSSLQYPDISGTGTLNGELPLKLTMDSVELQDGLLSGISPGVIHYQGPITDQENLAFVALRNLTYHSLQAKVNYQANGDYQLGFRLEGNNSQVLSGHPLAFNLNIDGHLPELFRRGIVTGDFERVIMQQLKAEPINLEKTAKPLIDTPSGARQPNTPAANRNKQ